MTSNEARKMTFDVGWAFVSSVLVMSVGFILKILLGNYFDTSGLGTYTIVFSLSQIITLIASIGLPVAVVKFIAEYSGKKGPLDSLTSAALVISILIGLIVTVITIITAPLFAQIFNITDLKYYLWIVALSFPFVMFNNVYISLFNGLRMMKHYTAFEALRNGMILTLTLVFVIQGFGLSGAIIALALPPPIVTCICLLTHRSIFNFKFTRFRHYARKITRFGGQLHLANVVSLINSQAAILLIGFYLTETSVGVYAIALMFFNFLMIFPSAVQKITYPVISKYFAEKNKGTIVLLVNTILRFSFTILSILTFLLLVFVDDMIIFIFPGKESFLLAITPLRILVLLGLMYCVITPVSIIFASHGRPDIPSKISVVKAVTNIGLGLLLIPISITIMSFELGLLNGAAIAIGISFIIEFILTLLYLPSYLKRNTDTTTLFVGFSVFILHLVILWMAVSIFGFPENIIGLILVPLYIMALSLTGILSKNSIDTVFQVIKTKNIK